MKINPEDFENKEVTLTANVPNDFAECVEKYHKEFNVELKCISNYKNHWKNLVVTGFMEDIILLNSKCEKEVYGTL